MRYNSHLPPVIAIDFDNTITNEHFNDFNKRYLDDKSIKPNEKWIKIIKLLKEWDVKLILYTCREVEYLEYAKNFLKNGGVLNCFDAINENIPTVLEEWGIGFPPRKPIYNYLVDDLALEFMNVTPYEYLVEIIINDTYLREKVEEEYDKLYAGLI